MKEKLQINMNKKSFLKTDTFLLLILYTITYGLILFNNGLYHDDWVIFNQNHITRIRYFKDLGFFLYWPGYLYNLLFSFKAGIFFEKLLIFLAFLFSSYFLYNILKNIKQIDTRSRLVITLFFSLFPVNFTRIFICNLNYTLSYFLFFFGFWFVSLYLNNNKFIYRIVGLILLFISFSANSLLFFYIIILFYIIYIENAYTLQIFMNKIVSYIDFLIIPVIFFVIKNIFFAPLGLYAAGNYNKITLKSILSSFSQIFPAFKMSFIDVFNLSFSFINWNDAVLLLILGTILFFWFKRKFIVNNEEKESSKNDIYFFILGIFIFFAAIFPYLIVMKMPSIYDAESRHQLLVPLGAAFMLYYGFKIFIKPKYNTFICFFIICLFIITNLNIYLSYQRIVLNNYL